MLGENHSLVNEFPEYQKIIARLIEDEYVLPPNVTEAYKKAPRSDNKSPSEQVMKGKWKGYTPPPMPKKP